MAMLGDWRGVGVIKPAGGLTMPTHRSEARASCA